MQGQNTHKTVSLPNDRPKQKKNIRFYDIFAIVLPFSIFLFSILCRPYHFAGRFNSPWLLLFSDCIALIWSLVVLVSEVWFFVSFVIAAQRKNIRRVLFSLSLFITIPMTILVHRSLSDLPSFTFFTGLKLWAIPRTDTDAIREWSSKFDVDEYVKVIPPEKWPDFIMSLKPEKVRIVNEEHDVIYTVITLNSTAFIPHYYGIAIIPKDDDEYSPNWRGAVLKVEPGFYVWQSIDH